MVEVPKRKRRIWLAALYLAIIVGVAGTVIATYTNALEASKNSLCRSNLRQLSAAAFEYARENNGKLPHRDTWADDLKPYVKTEEAFRCFLVKVQGPDYYGISFNSNLSGAVLAKVKNPERTPLFYDSINQARGANDPLLSFPIPGRHNDRNHVVYADGTVKAIPAPKLPEEVK